MRQITIAVYRPKPACEAALLQVVKDHMPILKRENLITTRKSIVTRSQEKSIVQIFEWKSADAIATGHHHAEVLKLWDYFNQVCEYVKPVAVKEFHNLFS